ncbi:MAG: ribulose-phosphate 3-epimerase [Planctomycetota bacterium]|jgi:ribulose-phosphate 3-epimerase
MSDARLEIQRVRDAEELSRAGAGLFVRLARKAIADKGRFFVALSGGSTPKAMFKLLARPPLRVKVAWDRVEIFFGDERAVPPDHPDSNYRMTCENLLSGLPIPLDRIHRMEAEREDLDEAARDYQARMASAFDVKADGPPPVFDLAFLGMGSDGHTASLFPHTEALKPLDRWVVGNYIPELDSHRMTMTRAVFNRAACVAFLAAGKDKAERLAEVLEGPLDPDRLPSQGIRPSSGRLVWMADRAAAAELEGKAARKVRIAPSILSADFAKLGEQVRQAEEAGADRLHIDVMDGHFVPNLSVGTVIVKSLRRVTRLPLETHLMITNPEKYVEPFAEAGSDTIIFHQETTDDWRGLTDRIRGLGMGVGVTISPSTSADVLEEIIPEVDLVLVMTMDPGFSGQEFMEEMLPKIAWIRKCIDQFNPTCDLEVDGGMNESTAARAYDAGARVLVAGSAVFEHEAGIQDALDRLRAAVPQ